MAEPASEPEPSGPDRTDPNHARCRCGHSVSRHQETTTYLPTLARSRGRMRSTITPRRIREWCLDCDCRRPT